MRTARQAELFKAAIWVGGATLVGQLLEMPLVGLLAGVSLVLGRQGWQIWRLSRWIERTSDAELPDADALWGQVFEELYQQQRVARRYQERLHSVINEFQASTAALPDATVALDNEGHITWCNEAAVTLLGLRLPQDLGLPILNLFRHPRLAEHLHQQGKAEDLVLPSPLDADIQLSLRTVHYGQGQKLLLARNVTQLVRMERIRRDFVANASHELRTPLTVIRGYLELLEEESREGVMQPWHRQLSEMRNQATRMSSIVDDMLKLARLEAHGEQGSRHEEVDVPRVLRSVLDEARAMSNGQHRLVLDADNNLRMLGHPSELHSIFANLVFNAVQYTPAKGEIRVRWWLDNAGLHYAVTDTGIGIEPRHIPRLTERFYRVDAARSRATGGTGLGLAIVKHALEHHEGRLEIRSRAGEGSTFLCHFPADRLRGNRITGLSAAQ